jgi:5-deoxy-glucuronate isomerase
MRRLRDNRPTLDNNDDAVTINPSKLPIRRPLSELLIRPADGITVATDAERAGWRYLSFEALALAADEETTLAFPDREAIVITIAGGGVGIAFDEHPPMELAGRSSVFSGMPWTAYIPPNAGARIVGRPWQPGDRSVIAYAQAPASGRTGMSNVPVLIAPDDIEIEIRGAGEATRQVNNIVMPSFPADRLLCCEVFTPGGNWSGWPPHRHDIDDMPREAVLEETYYFQVARPEGWGVARIYFRDGRPDALWAVRNGDMLLVPEGYHPFAANQGYDAYYLNFLAGDRRTMQASDDPDIAWVRGTWPSLDKDRRVPLVSTAEAPPPTPGLGDVQSRTSHEGSSSPA